MPPRWLLLLVVLPALPACQASVQAGADVSAQAGADDPGGPMGTPGKPTRPPQHLDPSTFTSITCNHAITRLGPGTYRGDLVVSGNHCLVEGAGADQTLIEGGLVLEGNHNIVRGLTVRAASRVRGNHNDASGASFGAGVVSAGNHNRP